MKRFVRSTFGKTTLFLLFIISAIVLAGSFVGIYCYSESDINWYTLTEYECYRNAMEYGLEKFVHIAYALRYAIFGIAIISFFTITRYALS